MTQKKTIPVMGMMCAVCAAKVEQTLSALDGMESVSVNLPGRSALVEYDPQRLTLEQMKKAVAQGGYDMVIEEDRSVETLEHRQMTLLLRKVILSWIFALLTMAISMGWITVGGRDVSNQTMLIIALACLIVCGRPFYASAWRQLCHGSANMDSLVALSTAVSFLLSAFNTFWGERTWGVMGITWHTYFDASVMIIAFVLTGRWLEERAKSSTASAIRSLMKLAPKTARVLTDGQWHEVPVSTLQKGDKIEVRAGERIPVDGSAFDHVAYVDEAMLTGEPVPVAKNQGDRVFAGTIVKQGVLHLKADQVAGDTVLAQMIRTVEQAQGSKAPVQRLVDRVALFFVPMVVIIAVVTLLAWWIIGGSGVLPQAILSAVSVLVIACPCALGLATPTALMVGMGKAAKSNILIKDATALERLCKVNAMVIDKTGTLTIPNADVDFTKASQLAPEERETLKPHAVEAVMLLSNLGIDTYMMSGDKEEAARFWAEKTGVTYYKSQVMPSDKEQQVRVLQKEGKVVAMVGDGINDTQALAVADVSIAMGKGTDVAIDAAQVTLMGTDLRRLAEAVALSRHTVAKIRQNLFWAFIYNVVCIPLAAGLPHLFGVDFHISPMWASAMMACSSISVVLNSLVGWGRVTR